jgi:hypothetical protein
MNSMKRLKLAVLSLITTLAASAIHAQQPFTNLNFESANLFPIPPGSYNVLVPVTSALPGWTAYIGSVQQAQVLQNDYTLGQASVDIFGPNYPAAGWSPNVYNPGTIDGSYSVLLQAGGDPIVNGQLDSVSLTQYGTVPLAVQSLEFKAWTLSSTEFSVSFDGNNLSPVVLGNGANYTLYGVDISSYGGQSGILDFTALFSGTGASWLGLDDITFSAAPEPSIVALTAIGGLLFRVRKWFARR